MKKLTKISAIVILMIASYQSTFAQASATATSTATIITPIAISKTVDMNFGNAAVTSSLGTVVLVPAGTRSATGGVTLPLGTPGTITAASFAVTGQANFTYSITLPGSATTLTSGGNTMTCDTWSSSPSATGLLDGTGAQTLTVGATLHVAGSQPAGTYLSGTPFTVTVNYN
jgi:hypothetical protein